MSRGEYDLAATIIEADAWINVPIATKITCCRKNQLSLFPGIVYGWNKTRGTEGHQGIPHAPCVIDETVIDLLSMTAPHFHVVDMMGFNPDDFEYAPLGYQHDIGPGSIDHVTVRGGNVADLADRFKKASMDYTSEGAEHADFGMGRRRWTLLGPLERDHEFSADELRALSPTPGSMLTTAGKAVRRSSSAQSPSTRRACSQLRPQLS